jgi:hypothetical protein
MATFPEIDSSGVAYQLQLFSGAVGGVPVMVGFPQGYEQLSNAEADLRAFADALAARWALQVTAITRYSTASAELAGA